MTKSFWAAAALLSDCCNYPGTDQLARYAAERSAVEGAVRMGGQVVELSEPIYEYPAPSGVCPDDALGCCTTGWCAGLFVPDAPKLLAGGATLFPHDVALHELTHEALGQLGEQPADGSHPPKFWRLWNAARRLRDAAAQPQAQ